MLAVFALQRVDLMGEDQNGFILFNGMVPRADGDPHTAGQDDDKLKRAVHVRGKAEIPTGFLAEIFVFSEVFVLIEHISPKKSIFVLSFYRKWLKMSIRIC